MSIDYIRVVEKTLIPDENSFLGEVKYVESVSRFFWGEHAHGKAIVQMAEGFGNVQSFYKLTKLSYQTVTSTLTGRYFSSGSLADLIAADSLASGVGALQKMIQSLDFSKIGEDSYKLFMAALKTSFVAQKVFSVVIYGAYQGYAESLKDFLTILECLQNLSQLVESLSKSRAAILTETDPVNQQCLRAESARQLAEISGKAGLIALTILGSIGKLYLNTVVMSNAKMALATVLISLELVSRWNKAIEESLKAASSPRS